MLSIFKHPKFPTTVFIIASMLNLFLMLILFFSLKMLWTYIALPDETNNSFSFTKKLKANDPLITKVPKFEDSLAGPIISDADPMLGNADAKVSIIQFSDFQCGYCREQEEVLRKTIADYGGKVRIIWKDYPEANKNSLSFQSALAGRCAQKQGKFWEFHDRIFKESGINYQKLLDLSTELDIDKDGFEKCMIDTGTEKQVLDNMAEADALDITGVPFFFINNREIMGNISQDELKRMIGEELQIQDQN